MSKILKCRFCQTELKESFAELGMSPLSNSYVPEGKLLQMEPFYPLHAYACHSCLLVQLPEFQTPQEIFSDYLYFSSFSESWLKHAERYCDEITQELNLTRDSKVVELASNDGYLLQYFKNKGISVLGVEPAANVAKIAISKGIPTETVFFGTETAKTLYSQGHGADLLIGNNVLAHVPDLNGFVKGMKTLLKPNGVITMEFPHLLCLIKNNEFDTIYHEHFSYFSILTVEKVFAHHGLALFDVRELPTHGGSVRIYARHAEDTTRPVRESVHRIKEKEQSAGLADIKTYRAFSRQVQETKWSLLEFLIRAKREGKRVAGYGAPAKGNTLLNFCGVRTDFLEYTVDRNPHKQGHYLPGTRIPIHAPDRIRETKPDFVLILPWNLREEISQQMAHIREWGGKFVVPIPRVEIF